MNGLGIFAGLGEGYMLGKRAAYDADAQKAANKLRNLQAEQAQAQEDLRKAVAEGAAGIGTRAKELQAQRDADNAATQDKLGKAADIVSQASSAADAAQRAPGTGDSMSPSTAGIVGSDKGQWSFKNAGPTPTASGIAGTSTDMASGTPLTPAANQPGKPVDLANSPGIRPNAARDAMKATVSNKLSDHDAVAMATRENFDKMSQLAMAKGFPDLAEHYQALGASSQARAFMRQFQNTYSAINSGDDQAAATAMSALYNLGFPDGKQVNIQPLGNGKFAAVQFDENTGKVTQGQTIDKNTLMDLLVTQMNPAEWAKLHMADTLERSRERTATIAAQSKERSDQARADRESAAADRRDAQLRETLASGERRTAAIVAGRDRVAETRAGAGGEKETPEARHRNEQLKAVSGEISRLDPNKIWDTNKRSAVASAAEAAIQKGGTTTTAAKEIDKAADRYDKAMASGMTQAKSELDTANGGMLSRRNEDALKKADPDAYKAATSGGKFNEGAWKKARAANLARSGMSGGNQVMRFDAQGNPVQ